MFVPVPLAKSCCCSHWNAQHALPVCQGADFKILMLVREALSGLELKYTADLRLHYEPSLPLKSLGQISSVSPEPGPEPHEELHISWFCSPKNASMHQICTKLLLFTSETETTQVLKRANGSQTDPLVSCSPTISVDPAHIVSLPERD